MQTFTKDTALLEHGRGTAQHVWISWTRHGRGTALYIYWLPTWCTNYYLFI